MLLLILVFCMIGSDSWWEGSEEFGDIVCLVPRIMSLTFNKVGSIVLREVLILL